MILVSMAEREHTRTPLLCKDTKKQETIYKMEIILNGSFLKTGVSRSYWKLADNRKIAHCGGGYDLKVSGARVCASLCDVPEEGRQRSGMQFASFCSAMYMSLVSKLYEFAV